MDQLPIIDISPLYGTDTQAWQAVAYADRQCLPGMGLFLHQRPPDQRRAH